ncbi:uncharacterized protein KY384_003072 [Bacidia gigantensis]|uniref:uncharacterized protein n=1 Tax=Bacidia gigantensis TaxID=2732470 RepID=UPI001D037B83|nr:uncharacterized protein KY384_003072 [Bacidia gigantensis]KAG8531443.1 hypothetical protein KY384_003072 [Bacidia gigantensis]
MDEPDPWTSDANQAVHISFIRPGESSSKAPSTVHPKFTYPIFGEHEKIFGYQNLAINLRFTEHDLRPHIEITYDKKYRPLGETKALDIKETLEPFVAKESFDKAATYNDRIQDDAGAKDFRPPGQLIQSYTSKGRNFEIWSGDLRDPDVRALVDRMQVLVSFFIEGGTPLDLEDQEWSLARWRIYLVYEKLRIVKPKMANYSFVGYSTSYQFIFYTPRTSKSSEPQVFMIPPSTPLHAADLPSRVRISQFLILPAHHSYGHGSHLYDCMVKTMLASSTCIEITVEDPSEAFDDLRDIRDYARLSSKGIFPKIKLNSTIDSKLTMNRSGLRVPTSQLIDRTLLETIRRQEKIAPRQFYRLIEMHLLSQIPPHTRQAGTARLTQKGRSSNPDDRAFYYWRLLVKQRVFKQNKEQLGQLDRGERADKVEQTVGEIVGDYERLMLMMKKWQEAEAKSNENEDQRQLNGPKDRGKRKVLEDDDDDTDMETPKRARSEVL